MQAQQNTFLFLMTGSLISESLPSACSTSNFFLTKANQNCEWNSKWGLSKSLHNANNIFFSAGNTVPGAQCCICSVDTQIIEPSTTAVFCWAGDSQQLQSTPELVTAFSILKWWVLFYKFIISTTKVLSGWCPGPPLHYPQTLPCKNDALTVQFTL